MRLNFQQLLLKPGEHMSWVFSLPPRIPVESIARLCVISDDFRASWHLLFVEELNGHAIVAIFAELFIGFLSQPVLPHILELIDLVVDAWGCE